MHANKSLPYEQQIAYTHTCARAPKRCATTVLFHHIMLWLQIIFSSRAMDACTRVSTTLSLSLCPSLFLSFSLFECEYEQSRAREREINKEVCVDGNSVTIINCQTDLLSTFASAVTSFMSIL